MPEVTAKREGKCFLCGAKIEIGDTVIKQRWKRAHKDCFEYEKMAFKANAPNYWRVRPSRD